VLEAFLARYGALALFIGVGVEGESVAILGGMLAQHGAVRFPEALAAAAAGSFLADQVLFLLGRYFRDHPLVVRLTDKAAFRRAFAAFERNPSAFVFAFRFLYGLRTVSPIAIGTSKLPGARFLALNAPAAVVWAGLFTSLGYFFGHGIEAFFGRLHGVGHLLAVATGVGLIAVAALLIVRLSNRRRGEGAHALTQREPE
jgi:membrane protein DedA with SNARE-associated domain